MAKKKAKKEAKEKEEAEEEGGEEEEEEKEGRVEKEKLKEEIKKDLKKELRLKKRKPLLFRFVGAIIKFITTMIIISLISLALAAGGAFLAYNFLPLKTITLCVSNEALVSPVKCSSEKDCIKSVANVIEVANETISEASDTGIGKGANAGINLMAGFLEFVFKEIGSCNKEGFCEIRKVRGLEQMMGEIIGKEAVNCTANEERREIKITFKTIIPPDKIIGMLKNIIESEEIRNTITEIIKTKKLPKFGG